MKLPKLVAYSRIKIVNEPLIIVNKRGKKELNISALKKLLSEREYLLTQKTLLLKEMRHRIANSLQLIASILILKASMVKSKETRVHLEDAHSRIMTVATVQEMLDPSALEGGKVKIGDYLKNLCASLEKSMIAERKPITLQVIVESKTWSVTSEEAIALGLITTELVINSLKHAFPHHKNGKVLVSYLVNRKTWILSVADDGIGFSKKIKKDQPGLGTGIVSALAAQMKAKVKTTSSKLGTMISLTNAK